jgi:U2-associated protein SR140
MKNASLFRTIFQDCLPEIMEHLRQAHRSIGGRMSANAMKEKVLSVLTAWEHWSLFPPHFLVGLNATFLKKQEETSAEEQKIAAEEENDTDPEMETLRKVCRQSGVLSSGNKMQLQTRLEWLREFTAPSRPTSKDLGTASAPVKSVAPSEQATNVVKKKDSKKNEGEEDVDGEPIDEEDLDGEPIDEREEDLDGEPMDEEEEGEDLDGVPIDAEEFDGQPLDEEESEENLNGEPLDEEDLDGEPMLL